MSDPNILKDFLKDCDKFKKVDYITKKDAITFIFTKEHNNFNELISFKERVKNNPKIKKHKLYYNYNHNFSRYYVFIVIENVFNDKEIIQDFEKIVNEDSFKHKNIMNPSNIARVYVDYFICGNKSLKHLVENYRESNE
jgi:hypothetical protein